MRKLLIYSIFALFVCAFSSCSKDEVFYDFGETPSVAATFSAGSLKYNELTEADNGKVSIPMYRGNTKGAASVAVEIAGGEGIFTPAKSSFDFADGENVAYLDFTFDFEGLSPKPATIKISIVNDADCIDGAVATTSVTLVRQLTWEYVGDGLYYTDFFGQSWPQPIYKAQEGDFYMLPDCWVSGTDFTFFCDGTTVDWYTSVSGYNYGSYGPIAFGVTDQAIESTEDGMLLSLGVVYYLPEYYDYQLGSGVETFEFPEGFEF